METVTEQQLAHTGGETISVGGPGWRESVHIDRSGWEPVGNGNVYHIRMWESGEEQPSSTNRTNRWQTCE